MDYEEGISCFVVTAAAEFHVVPFRQNKKNYPCIETAVEEIKEHFECEANEDVLQENKSVAREDIIEMKNNDTDNEEEMKAVIMIVDDEHEENTPLSTLNSSTEKLEYKEIKKETISNYDSCNAADTDTSLFEGVRSEPGHCRKIDFSRINFLKTLHEYHNLQIPKPNNTNTKRQVSSDLYCPPEILKKNETKKDKEDEEKIPLSTAKPISSERCQNHETKKDKENEEKIPLSTPKPFSTERLNKNETNKDKEDRRINFLKTLQEYHNLQKPKSNNTKTETKVWSDLCCRPLRKQSYNHLKSLETHMKGHGKWNLQEEKEDKEKIPLSTPKPFSTERLQKNETKKDKEDEEEIPLSTPKPISTERLKNNEAKKDNISDNESCNAGIDKLWSSLMCPLCQRSYKHPKSLETHMKKIHGKQDFQVEKKDKEKTRLSTRKSTSIKRLENKDIKEDTISNNKYCNPTGIDISTLFEGIHYESGPSPEVDRRINFLEILKNYHKSNKPKTNNTKTRTKIWGGLYCAICKLSYKHQKALENHIKSHEPDGDLILKSHKSACFGQYFKSKEEADNHYNRSVHSEINKCLTCHKIYTDPDKLEIHKRYAHKQNIQIPTETNDEKFSVCKICAKKFPNETALSDHEKSGCATSPIFKCDECGKIFRHVLSFKRHRTVHTGELPHLCNFCGKAFRTYRIVKSHERREHCKGKLFKCSASPSSMDPSIMDFEENISCFVVTAAAEFHVVPFGQNKKNDSCIETVINEHIKCEANGDEENSPLSSHNLSTVKLENESTSNDEYCTDTSTPFKEVRYECGHCPRVYFRRISFLKHLKNDHNSPHDYQLLQSRRKMWSGLYCALCKRSYKHPKSLANHIKSHGPDGELIQMSACFGQYFKNKEEADNHNRSIHNEIIKCEICDKIYADYDKLVAHQQYAHKQNIQIPIEANDEKRYFSVCRKCGKKFTNKTALSDHKRSHCGRSPLYKCDECDTTFRSHQSLKIHNTIHTGELPHLCNFCGKAFRTYGQVRVHEKEHNEEKDKKPFKCSICARAFVHEQSLINHLTLHKV